MEDRTNLARKLVWVQDYADSLEGESLPQLQAAITRVSRGRPLFANQLSRADADELSGLCDGVAAENGHTWNVAGTEKRRKRGFFRRRGS